MIIDCFLLQSSRPIQAKGEGDYRLMDGGIGARSLMALAKLLLGIEVGCSKLELFNTSTLIMYSIGLTFDNFCTSLHNYIYYVVRYYAQSCDFVLLSFPIPVLPQSYDELMSLAEMGDETRVGTIMSDVTKNSGEVDFYTVIPDEIVIFDFGKALDQENAGMAESGENG